MAEWRLRKEWPEGPLALDTKLSELQRQTGLSPLALRVCLMRGLSEAGEIRDFLYPKLDGLTDPFKMAGMRAAVERLELARQRGDRILVFGDYDVDGTCGTALLSWVFREMGFNFRATQPDRFKDGYGLNVQAIEAAAELGEGVVITVDCGISSFQAAERARELGIDLIILDHHQIDSERGLPQACAVVNPQRADCQSGLKQLCGCGVAFYLAMALRTYGRSKGWFHSGPGPNLRQYLDLVVIATAADQVPLVGDNRILVRHGMQVLEKSPKPGVRALLQVAGLLSRNLSPSHLGFALGPRINASGRLENASHALELLTSQDHGRCQELAQTLERLNQERMLLQSEIWEEVRERVDREIQAGMHTHAILVGDERWHEGVIGIVASRVTEKYQRPAAVVALREGGGKGSVRSYAGLDVLEAVRGCSEYLAGFGGHKYAAGFSTRGRELSALAYRFSEAVGELKGRRTAGENIQPLFIEGECILSDLSLKAFQELESLGPFGPGNPEPVFTFSAEVKSRALIKNKHIRLNLSALDSASPKGSRIIEAIWFNAGEDKAVYGALESGFQSTWAGVPEMNRFRGEAKPVIRIRDARIP